MEVEEKYGPIDEMNVCANLGRHLYGNVYIKFRRSRDAERAILYINNRWFDGRPINAELSPVTDFQLACCPQYDHGDCERGDFCNFMHLKPISREMRHNIEDHINRREEKSRDSKRRKVENKRIRKLKNERKREDRKSRSINSSLTNSTSYHSNSQRSSTLSSHKSVGKRNDCSSSSRSSPDYGYSRKSVRTTCSSREGSLEKYALSNSLKSTIPSKYSSNNSINTSAANYANLVEAYFNQDSSPETS